MSSILDLRPVEREKYGTAKNFIASLTREDIIRVITHASDMSRVCCVSREGDTCETVARLLVAEIEKRAAY